MFIISSFAKNFRLFPSCTKLIQPRTCSCIKYSLDWLSFKVVFCLDT